MFRTLTFRNRQEIMGRAGQPALVSTVPLRYAVEGSWLRGNEVACAKTCHRPDPANLYTLQ